MSKLISPPPDALIAGTDAGVPRVTARESAAEFHELFAASPRQVLQAMEEAGDDVAAQEPSIRARIDGVGLTRHHVPVMMRSPFDAGATVTAVCRVRISCGVPSNRRGLHLSRIGHAMAESVSGRHDDAAAYAVRLAQILAASQYGHAIVDVDASIAYVEETGAGRAADRKQSLERLRLVARAAVSPSRTIVDTGLRVSHIVACPCVQQTYKHALQAASVDAPSGIPLLTHSQRCLTTVVVRNLDRPFSVPAALAALDTTLVRTSNTLPRDRELARVYRAHRSPQFIEDALRGAVLLISRLWPDRAFDRVQGRSRSLESIHEYDLRAAMTIANPSRGGAR
jgi:GTP cyclohydrolase FolE2